ncbi:BRCA2-interacting transcriptional repressor EMSY isoform X10 [Ursus maritimus]|uniref:BRCA2-interacting transcriptional repressor EMSY n=1 Tax=Ursus maritimus TaxID=29073 RepID=A0A8M1G3D9_URSMA|nr:BRCA2-interacting transcriptional repressor EMSY isoform X10 [Ursus maritimus]
MPVVWPTLLDLSRDECKRILRKLELEAYAGVISALRAQGDLTKEKKDLLGELSKVLSISTERHRAEVRRAVNDERLTTIAHKMNLSLYLGERPSYSMSGPNSSSEWSIEGRRLVPLMPRLVPQTAFTVTANAVANAAVQHNASLPVPAETGSKEVVVCYSYTSTTSTPTSTPVPSGSIATVKSPRPASPASNVVVLPSGSTVYVKSVSCSDEDEKPRKRRRTNSSSSSPVVLKEVPKAVVPVSKTITVPVSGSPKMSNIMQSIANSLPPHMSPVKITFTKPSTQTTNTTTQKVIIVTTSPSSTFVPNILSKSHNYAAVTKLVPTSVIASTTQKPPVVITASQSSLVSSSSSGSSSSTPSPIPNTVAVTAVVSSTPSVVMSTVAQGVSTSAIKMASTRLPSPKSLVGAPTQILAQFPKQHQQSPKQQLHPVQQQTQQQVAQPAPVSHQQQPQQSPLPPGIKPTIQIKQESGVKIITQQVQPSKILPKPVTATLPTSSNSPIMVVSSNGAIMTTKLVTTPTGTQATYTRPTVSPSIGRMAATPGAATYVKTTSGSIITVVPKSLATLGGKIISSNIVSVKEKLESKPRQPTIDLSQMAVPIQMTQEKRHSPESPSIAVVESELVAEYITTERTDEGTEVAFPLLDAVVISGEISSPPLFSVSHRSQPQQPSQPQRTLLQHVAQSQTATQTSVVVKSIPASSPGAITHIMQQALSSHTAFTKHSEELGTEEGEVEEMDTLDPQTGLFYRSALTQSQSAKQQKLSQPQLEQTQLQVKTLQCFQTKQKQTIHLQADQLQHKLPQMPQLSIRHQKLTPLQQEQAQPKPDVQHTQHPMVAKDRQLPTLMAQPPQTVVQVLAVKTTQQLPKLQQAPNQPKIYVQPQTPQSQMPLPAASEKQPASQVEQPIITQGSSVTKITFEGRQPPTVTKITGGSSVPKLTSPVTSISPIQASEKTAVSDILKMSLMEAQIDTNVEHVVVDPPKKALATSMLTGEAGSLPSTHVVVAGLANSTPQQQKCRESCSSPSAAGPPLTTRKIDAPGVPTTGQFMRIQNVGQKKAEESPAEIIIQAIPQYAIPCHSSSNVVVEPSGLLELNNFTSQQLDDDETAMEQDIDSSTEDGTEPSPSQSSAERS